MSEIVNRLPLFPLNLVLFPGQPLGLHIFEERYKEMLAHCLRTDKKFGVVLIREGREARGPLARVWDVGTIARIEEWQPLPGGRFQLKARGNERFHLRELNEEKEYLRADVEILPEPDPPRDPYTDRPLRAAGLQILVERYLNLLAPENQEILRMAWKSRAGDPADQLWLAAGLLQVGKQSKQKLLSVPRWEELTEEMQALYREQVRVLETRQQASTARGAPRSGDDAGFGPFSLN